MIHRMSSENYLPSAPLFVTHIQVWSIHSHDELNGSVRPKMKSVRIVVFVIQKNENEKKMRCCLIAYLEFVIKNPVYHFSVTKMDVPKI